LDDCDLDDWLERLAVKHKFAISAHTVEVTGTCADCR
jgi:Fe2+ or Zn2+ uptake regulation protein